MVGPEVDFIKIFESKLETIKPFDEREGIRRAEWFQDIGIQQLKRDFSGIVLWLISAVQ